MHILSQDSVSALLKSGENGCRNHFMINLHKLCAGTGALTHDPWICSQMRCWLRYRAWPRCALIGAKIPDWMSWNLAGREKPEDHWSCITHLSAEGMLKSAVLEEKRVVADNPLGPNFLCQQEGLITMVICCKFKKNRFNLNKCI